MICVRTLKKSHSVLLLKKVKVMAVNDEKRPPRARLFFSLGLGTPTYPNPREKRLAFPRVHISSLFLLLFLILCEMEREREKPLDRELVSHGGREK